MAVVLVLLVVTRFGLSNDLEWWDQPLEYENKGIDGKYSLDDVTSAKTCGTCHVVHYEQWSRSAMARSVEYSRFLIEMFELGLDARGAPVDEVEQCLHCHAPLANFGPNPDLKMKDALVQEGVTCDVCHTAAVSHPDKNPGYLEWDLKGPKRGPLYGTLDTEIPEGEIRAVSSYHETKRSELFESSDLCGSCHMSKWPTNDLPIDWTYREWLDSPYAEQGVTCQDCHMKEYTGVSAPGAPERTDLHDHSFPGRSDLDLVRSTATVKLRREGDDVVAEVENVGSGHAFPTGNATAPSVYLELMIYGEKDELLAQSRVDFKLIYGDAEGNPVIDPTAAAQVLSDTTLQPLIPQYVRLEIPAGSQPTRVEGVLTYSPWDNGGLKVSTVVEFVGRYIRNGYHLESILTHVGDLHQSGISPPRGVDKIEVTQIELSL